MSVFILPDVGEGLVEADIIEWKVAPGDVVNVNDVLVEIETAKSVVELPSPFSGTVSELLAAEGDTVDVGAPIIRFTGATAEDTHSPFSQSENIADKDAHFPKQDALDPNEPSSGEKVLVGYGLSTTAQETRVSLRSRYSHQDLTEREKNPEPSNLPQVRDNGPAETRPRATPPVRAFAKRHDAPLTKIEGTGPAGRIQRVDVENYLRNREVTSEATHSTQSAHPAGPPREERQPFKGVRKAISQAMVRSYSEIPHASVSVEFDITETMDFIELLKARPEYSDMKLTPLLFVARALIRATKLNPKINTIIDGDELVQRHYINLGIAAATPRGLIVPNIKDAHLLTLRGLEESISQLVRTARDGKTTPEDQSNGTITITNAGVFGVDTGMPIINPGEPAIVGMGAIREKPWVVEGQIVPRKITNIGVTVDHRILDGDVAGKFASDIVEALSDPRMLAVE
jgi:pyruvate dehydrogenase E2 component (dihydrolipoamide acetyltransferase)